MSYIMWANIVFAKLPAENRQKRAKFWAGRGEGGPAEGGFPEEGSGGGDPREGGLGQRQNPNQPPFGFKGEGVFKPNSLWLEG